MRGERKLTGQAAMKVSRTIAYAIHATLQLSAGERGVPVPCSQLASEGQMPERFLLQILRSLVTHGLLRSTRGVEGGYCLARPPEQISLRDIVESFDNPLTPSVPMLDGLSIEVTKRLMTTLGHASTAAREELEKLTLADLLRANRRAE
jgi:Rrf2 family transcriptional regulator, cysteine metabolism repressor